MIIVHESLRGISGLVSLTKTKEDKALLWELLQSLFTNISETLMMENTHQLKGIQNRLFQISLNSMRIVYFRDEDNLYILHFFYKQGNKPSKKDVKTADKRANDFK